MSKVLFVVHRYSPYPGGSENNTKNMAEGLFSRGHSVTVLAHEHKGDLNGVWLTSDYNVLVNQKWDLVIIHGCDVISQNIAHVNAANIKSPILYLIIKPTETAVGVHGMKFATRIGYGTTDDIEHLRKFGYLDKGRRVRYGIVPEEVIGTFTERGNYYISAGGFSPHKGMNALADIWNKSNVQDELHLYGYSNDPSPPETDKVKIFRGKSKKEVMDAIACSKGYIMNSYEEGFGLVLLEAMINKVSVFSRNIAGAKDMGYMSRYDTEEQLMEKIRAYRIGVERTSKANYEYVMTNHTVRQQVNDIEDILRELA
jgi:glycosyltransferase involved in cell wall biosynthesis